MADARVGLGLLMLQLLSFAAPARADEPTWTLSWSAPPMCPHQALVKDLVASWLARSSERSDPRGVHVRATVHQEGAQFVLKLQLTTPSGQETELHTSQRCETLANVIALKVALAADPAAWFDERESEATRSGVRSILRASVGATFGVLPETRPTIELSVAVNVQSLGFELGVAYNPAARVTFSGSRMGAEIDLLTLNPRVCWLPTLGELELPLCGGIDVGVASADPFYGAYLGGASLPYAALVLGLGARLRIVGDLFGWVGADMLVPVLRPNFAMRDYGTLWSPAAAGARFQLGPEVHFD